jgi:hypothetical protein
VAGLVSCTANTGLYVVCPAYQGCTSGFNSQVICGDGTGTGTGAVMCDGPSDCPVNSDCCTRPGNPGSFCVARPQSGVIGSGCAALDPNPMGPQSSVVCDPLNPTANCPVGKSCVTIGGAQASFLCQ